MIFLLAASLMHGNVTHHSVDLIELNHFFDTNGEHAYDQVIFYEWSPDYRRFQVMSWRLVEKLGEYPRKQGGTLQGSMD